MANLLLVTLEICNCDRCFPRQIVVDDINSELFVSSELFVHSENLRFHIRVENMVAC